MSDANAGRKIIPAEGADCRPAVAALNSGGVIKGVLTGEALANWVAKGCLAQGVPVKVTDQRVIDKVKALLSGGAGGPERSVSFAGPTGSRS